MGGGIAAAIVAFFASDALAGIGAKLLILASVATLSIAFTSKMVEYAQTLIQPAIPFQFLAGLAILPPSTATYLTLIISATMAKWLFIASVKAISVLK